MNPNEKNNPPKYKGINTGESASQPPKFEGNTTAQAAVEPPKLESIITNEEAKPSKDGKTFRRIVIIVLVIFAISQLILFFYDTQELYENP